MFHFLGLDGIRCCRTSPEALCRRGIHETPHARDVQKVNGLRSSPLSSECVTANRCPRPLSKLLGLSFSFHPSWVCCYRSAFFLVWARSSELRPCRPYFVVSGVCCICASPMSTRLQYTRTFVGLRPAIAMPLL